jgi:type IV pilus assembly protein PilB
MPTQLGETATLQILERHIDVAGELTPDSSARRPMTEAAPVYVSDERLPPGLEEHADEVNREPIELTDDLGETKELLHDSSLAPVAKLLNVLLRKAISSRATEIHIKPTESDVLVRLRVDGALAESFRLPKWVHASLIGRCKLVGNLDLDEQGGTQQGRTRLRTQDELVDVHVSTVANPNGEEIIMRIVYARSAARGLDEINLSASDLDIIRRALKRPEGMILVTGPAESGKTSTLYGLLREIASPNRNIVSIEHRVHFRLPSITQIAIEEQGAWTVAGALHAVLRQDPEVIAIDEMRDLETAEMALRAAETGRLILASMQGADAAAAVSLLLGVGLEPDALAASLQAVIAQRLVRRICPQCVEPYQPDGAALNALRLDDRKHSFVHGRGCVACRNSGYAGRIAIIEVLPITDKLAALIEKNASENVLRARAGEDGIALLAENAARLIDAGMTTVEEVLSVLEIPLDGAAPSRPHAPEQQSAVGSIGVTSVPHMEPDAGIPTTARSSMHSGSATVRAASPRTDEAAARAPQPVAAESASEPATRTYRVLVVDDQAEVRRLVRHTLERSGLPLSIVEAADGHQALELVRADAPDLVVLDVMMPGLNGFEVCQQLRADIRSAFVPILMLTALDDAGNRVQGYHAGTDDYLGKPFVRAEFLARVRRLIERSYGTTLQIRAASQASATPPVA